MQTEGAGIRESSGCRIDLYALKTDANRDRSAFHHAARTMVAAEWSWWVAYLLAADIVSRLPSCRLSDDHQPVIMTRNRFSTPRSSLFPSLYAHPSRSIPRSSTGILF